MSTNFTQHLGIDIPPNKQKAYDPEYLVVSDINSKVILSTSDYKEAVRLTSRIRQAGGSCTIFKSLKS